MYPCLLEYKIYITKKRKILRENIIFIKKQIILLGVEIFRTGSHQIKIDKYFRIAYSKQSIQLKFTSSTCQSPSSGNIKISLVNVTEKKIFLWIVKNSF